MDKIGARVFLELLREYGVDKIFIVSGTDYAAFIEEKSKDIENSLPEFVIVPHEITAAAVAMGYSIGGKIGVAAVHTTPGTANSLGIIMNAYASRIPLIVIAGRSPYTEKGNPASRNLKIHWTQEARDQGEIVRQWVKWDFEIRRADQIPDTVTRAIQIALSEPKGPVYIMIPREVSIERVGNFEKKRISFTEPGPSKKAIEEAAKMINESDNPVIIAGRVGRKKEWFDSLVNFANKVGIPVLNYVEEVLNYPSEGPMALDYYDLNKVDLIIVLEQEVPWIPKYRKINARIIRVDVDPLYLHIPYYGFECDLCIQSNIADFLNELIKYIKLRDKDAIRELKIKQEEEKLREVKSLSSRKPIHPIYLSYNVGKLGLPIINEYPLNAKYAKLNEFNSYFSNPALGHLGWALGASIGYKLATGKDVICVVGDGSFIFGVPHAFYYMVRKVPVLTVIYDNGGWLASAHAVKEVFPDGNAVKTNNFPGAYFEDKLILGKEIEYYGGFYKLVEEPEDVEISLKQALEYLSKGKPAILQVIVDRIRGR
jgi:acetolactate synthase-1/2/3 large subunit